MARQKTLKRLKGRLKELEHLDIIEVKWVDAASGIGWKDENSFCQTILCSSVGYFDGVYGDKAHGSQIHLYADKSLENKSYARTHGIPIENIKEIRLVSKGKVLRG